MAKTGESYTAARARLLSKQTPAPLPEGYAGLTGMSDDAVSARTGRTWPEWVGWLDERNAASLPHPEIAALIHADIGDGWWSQMVTVGYERIRGLREPGQRRDGLFESNRSRTLPIPAEEAFRWVDDPELRGQWITEPHAVRGTNPPKSVRLDWPDGTRVQLYVDARGEARAQVTAQHTHLPDRDALESMRGYWSERLDTLKDMVS